MIRKTTAFLLTILLGLYLPAAATSVCFCLGSGDQSKTAACCEELTTCCEEHQKKAQSCCEDPDCCLIIPALPDGMEPQLAQAPLPVSLPALIMVNEQLQPAPSIEAPRSLISHPAPPPPPGAPIRIAFGVWRL